MAAHPTNNYDIILIGSGIGALTVASLMTQLRGKRVLILERHFVAGGYTHSFHRKGYQWDPGLHYVGQMAKGSSPRSLFDLVTHHQVDWQPMPEPFEKFVYPDWCFELYGDSERFQADLIQRFPMEARAIRRYVKDLRKGMAALFLHAAQQNGAWWFKLAAKFAKLWHRIDLDLSTQEYLDRHFRDPQLKALLVSQWLDYGLPPQRSPFALHATIANHYSQGGYYPVGGAGRIAESVQQIVESRGGRVLLNREVTEVLIDGGRAAGVRACHRRGNTKTTEEYFAPVVVSDVGAFNTYCKLVPDSFPIPFRGALKQFLAQHPPATNVSLYIGFAEDPRRLGFQGENHWIYQTYDHQDIARKKGEWLSAGQPLQMYLSFPSLKDPGADQHTAEAIAIADYASFAQWRDQPWRHRDEDYAELKSHLRETLLEMIEQHYPGFNQLIDYCEVSTPVTNEHFTDHPKGGIYGMPVVPERFTPKHQSWTQVQTPLPGLYMTGSDVYVPGIVGAMMGALLTVSQLPSGMSIPRVFAAARKC